MRVCLLIIMTQFTSCISLHLPAFTFIYLFIEKAIMRCKPCPAIYPHLPSPILPFHPLLPHALSFAGRNFSSSSSSFFFFFFNPLFLSSFFSFFSSIFLSNFLLLTIYHLTCPSICPLFLLFSNITGTETWRLQLNFI